MARAQTLPLRQLNKIVNQRRPLFDGFSIASLPVISTCHGTRVQGLGLIIDGRRLPKNYNKDRRHLAKGCAQVEIVMSFQPKSEGLFLAPL